MSRKEKARPKSKAALATQAARATRERSRPVAPDDEVAARPEAGLPPAEEPRSGGLLMGMRSGFQSAVGQGAQKKKSGNWVNTVLFVLVLAAAVFFFMRGR